MVSVAISGMDIIPPIDAPELNKPWANARSLIGNHSALDLVAPGQFLLPQFQESIGK